ncbi:MAG: hypothetical protein JKY87_02250 [Mariprofundus sp.]|nr:hypothetical protein [Mariprofundus sp.]
MTFCCKYLLLILVLLLNACSSVDDRDVIVLNQCQFSMQGSESWQPLQLPDNWNVSRPDVGGVGLYRFELHLDVAPNRLWALLLPRVSNNAAVYLNGRLVGIHGGFEGHSITWNSPFLVSIPSGMLKSGSNIIEIKVAAKANYFGRLLPPMIGAEAYIEPRYEQLYFGQIILSQICTVFALTMAICMLSIWWYRRESMYGWFALGGLSWALYALYFFVTDLPLPLEQWIRFCFSCSLIMLSSMLLFIGQFMGWKHKRQEQVFMVYCLFGILLLLLLPDDQLFDGIKWIMAGYAVMYGLLGLALINALRFEQSKQHALTSLLGIGINIGLGLHDWANIFFMLNQPYLLQYGQPLIFLVIGRHLLKDYMIALHTSEATNAELDQRVHLREKELRLSLQKTKQAEQDKLLLEERERMMHDLHDGIGGQLISALSQARKAKGLENMPLQQTISDALLDLRLVIDSLDEDMRNLPALLGMLRMRLEPQMRAANIRLVWQVQDGVELDYFGSEVSLHLLRIVQEALTNAIRHAQCSEIRICIERMEDEICVMVVDNGIGMGDAIAGRGRGNMRRRAEKIGAVLQVGSSDQGVQVQINIQCV